MSCVFLALAAVCMFGVYRGRSISWGGLLGGISGAIAGFYVLLLIFAMLWPSMSYEKGMPFLLVGAGLGWLAGGYALSALLKKLTRFRG